MTGHLSYRQTKMLLRLEETPPGGAMAFSGQAAIACHTLAKKGLAKFVGQGQGISQIFQPTDEGHSKAKELSNGLG